MLQELEVVWLDGPLYVIKPQTPNSGAYNPWHWAVDVLPLWHLQFTSQLSQLAHQASRASSSDFDICAFFPPMDYIFALGLYDTPDWNMWLIKLAAQNHSKVLSGISFIAQPSKEQDGKVNEEQQRSDRRDIGLYGGIDGAMEKKITLGLKEDRRLVCSEKVVVPGHRYQLFNSLSEAQEFRRKAYSEIGIGHLFSSYFLSKPPARVLFKKSGRVITNFQGSHSALPSTS